MKNPMSAGGNVNQQLNWSSIGHTVELNTHAANTLLKSREQSPKKFESPTKVGAFTLDGGDEKEAPNTTLLMSRLSPERNHTRDNNSPGKKVREIM
jgi:hypothetical protein